MRSFIALGLTVMIGVAAAPACAGTIASTVVGRLDVHVVGERTVFVAVPARYDSTTRIPVLYLQDGEDLFDAARASGGNEWGVDELLAAEPAGIPPLLVVGIEAAPQARLEYAPPGTIPGAAADAYLRFVLEVVKPFIDARYATRAEADWTWIGGEEAGGVVALYAGWTRPDVFGGAIALGLPDLAAADIEWLRTTTPRVPLRLWIDQQGGGETRGSTTQLLAQLQRGARVDLRMAGETTPPLVRLGAALRSLAAP